MYNRFKEIQFILCVRRMYEAQIDEEHIQAFIMWCAPKHARTLIGLTHTIVCEDRWYVKTLALEYVPLAHEQLQQSFKKIGDQLNLAPMTCYRIYQQYKENPWPIAAKYDIMYTNAIDEFLHNYNLLRSVLNAGAAMGD